MEIEDRQIDQQKIKTVIEKRLVHAPRDIKAMFSSVLRQQQVLWVTISQLEYLMVVFLTPEEEKRINGFISEQLNPFPGLITTGPEGAAFRVEKSKYMTLSGNRVSNSFALSLGPDSTILLVDHHQSINTKEKGVIAYTIPLAYVVSYGDEIDSSTAYEYFDGLVSYSIDMWRKSHA